MKTRSKFFLSVTALSLLLLIGIPVVSAGPASKVDVCHLDADTGVYHMINISENAFQAHFDHGDGSPGDAVSGWEGYIFGADCTPELGYNTTTMFFEWECFDLEEGVIYEEPFPGFDCTLLYPQADFYFGLNATTTPYATIVTNWFFGPVQIAYSDEPFADVNTDDIGSLVFSPIPSYEPFNQVTVLLTTEGNYYKLGFISEGVCGPAIGGCVTFKWAKIYP